MNKKIDVIVVGQGLAGSWLSYYLLEAGMSVIVVDSGDLHSSSRIASGIMNPITGHKHVKTWMADTVLPFAGAAYQALGDRLGVSLCRQKELIWLLDSAKAINDFSVLSDRVGYADFMGTVSAGPYCSGLGAFAGYGTVYAHCADMSIFLGAYQHWLSLQGLFVEAQLSCDELQIQAGGVVWRDWVAQRVLFCEGYAAALSNRFFSYLPFVPAKGEVLLVEIAGLSLGNAILKSGIFVLPTAEKNVFWVGSNYEHTFSDGLPSAATRHYLQTELDKVVSLPYKVQKHWASIRPASRDRRPFVGIHPTYPQLGVFNGMGTKGVSLSPYFAHQFATHLSQGTALSPEVAISRIR